MQATVTEKRPPLPKARVLRRAMGSGLLALLPDATWNVLLRNRLARKRHQERSANPLSLQYNIRRHGKQMFRTPCQNLNDNPADRANAVKAQVMIPVFMSYMSYSESTEKLKPKLPPP